VYSLSVQQQTKGKQHAGSHPKTTRYHTFMAAISIGWCSPNRCGSDRKERHTIFNHLRESDILMEWSTIESKPQENKLIWLNVDGLSYAIMGKYFDGQFYDVEGNNVYNVLSWRLILKPVLPESA